jgi:hypothetical protein
MKNDSFESGASASLNKTITDLHAYITDPGSRNRGDLRKSMNEMIADLVVEWTEYGFYLGHREAYRALRDNKEIPATLKYEERDWEVVPNCARNLELESRIRRT